MGIGQPYARVDLNPMSESTLCSRQGLRILPMYTIPHLTIETDEYQAFCFCILGSIPMKELTCSM
jgi:hypothetical protein